MPKFQIAAALAAALLMAACEPDDPKIRQEVAELRTRTAELERDNNRMNTELAELKNKLTKQVEFLGTGELARRLDAQMPQLRTTLARAFPGYSVDPVTTGAVSTPVDEDALPYTTEVSFGLSKGGRISTYNVRIAADRGGSWILPDPETLAAAVGKLPSGGSERVQQQTQQPATTSGRGAAMTSGVRQIDWGDTGSGAAPAQQYVPAQAPVPQPPVPPPAQRQSAPSGNAPFPVQDSRTIQFE